MTAYVRTTLTPAAQATLAPEPTFGSAPLTPIPPLRFAASKPAPHPAVRYAELVPEDRHLLLVLEAQGGHGTDEELATTLNCPPHVLDLRLNALAGAGMLQRDAGRCTLPLELRSRVARDLNATVGARVVLRCDETLRGPPAHPGERVLWQVCRELFTPHPVRSRVPLRQVLDVQVMGSLLDQPDRAFLGHAHVHLDLLVEHAGTGRPLLALELDGPQHGESPQLERDMRKDRILRVAGLPLMRLWTCEAEPPGEGLLRALLRWRLQQALADQDVLGTCPPTLREVLREILGSSAELEAPLVQDNLAALLGPDLLTGLLGAGQSLAATQARRQVLEQIVTALRATDSQCSVQQWFERPRYSLRGQSPRDVLQGAWAPEDAAVRIVCRLAAAGGRLVT